MPLLVGAVDVPSPLFLLLLMNMELKESFSASVNVCLLLWLKIRLGTHKVVLVLKQSFLISFSKRKKVSVLQCNRGFCNVIGGFFVLYFSLNWKQKP